MVQQEYRVTEESHHLRRSKPHKSKNKLASNEVTKKQKMSVTYDHFLQSHIDEFYTEHGNKQGIACLGFEVGRGGLESDISRYRIADNDWR